LRVFVDWPRPSETGDREPARVGDEGISFEAGFRTARSHAQVVFLRFEGAAGRVREWQVTVSPDGAAQVQELRRVEPRFDVQGPDDDRNQDEEPTDG
jgi:hypothetical protein